MEFQLDASDIDALPSKITLDNGVVLDLKMEFKVRSYSRSFFSPVKLSMTKYMKEMINKNSKKTVAVYDAMITRNSEKLKEELSDHRHWYNIINCCRNTTGMDLFTDASNKVTPSSSY